MMFIVAYYCEVTVYVSDVCKLRSVQVAYFSLVIFSVKIHVKLPHDSLFAVKIFIDFSEN